MCKAHGIEQRLIQVKHSWTNGQVERMNRTIKEASVKRFHDEDHAQLHQHLARFMAAYDFGRSEGAHALQIHLQTVGLPA